MSRPRAALVALVACLGLALSSSPARAATLDDLYANRLLFAADGTPLVPVRMMERQTRVELSAASGLVVESDGRPPLALSPGASVVVERTGGKAAPVDVRWVLETLEGGAREERDAALQRWAERRLHVRLQASGGVYGMHGTVVDNRALLVVTSARPPEDAFERWGVRPVEHVTLRGLPGLSVRVTPAGQGAFAVGSASSPAVVRVRAKADGGTVVVKNVEHSIGYANHGFADRELRGEVVLLPDRYGSIAVVNVVPEAVLVAGILPSEMFASAPMEALKAQAVTARGELFAKIGRRHAGDPYLVCSEQHCQVYKGKTAEHPRSNAAAEETAGELAFDGDRVVDSVYSACCGGHTEPAHVVWDRPEKRALVGRPDTPGADPHGRAFQEPAAKASYFTRQLSHGAAVSPVPSLGPVPLDLRQEDDVRRFLALPRELTFCGRSSFNQKGDAYRWERRITAAELDAYTRDLGVGRVKRLVIDERGPGGRLMSLLVEGTQGSARIHRELPVRRRFGNLRSGLFVIDEERDAQGALVAVTLRGGGFGHGSGMCQQGAIGMAEAGYDYREILRHYYNGAVVRRVF